MAQAVSLNVANRSKFLKMEYHGAKRQKIMSSYEDTGSQEDSHFLKTTHYYLTVPLQTDST